MADKKADFIEINGCKTEIWRGGSGPTLLFLHGAGGITSWAPYLDEMAQSYEVVAPSHPGFGGSGNPDWLDSVSDLAFFYLDFINALKLQNIHLVGNSLGGWIASEIAIRSIENIKTLTLVSAAGLNVVGVPMGDIFMWSNEETAKKMFYDQNLATQRIAASQQMTEAQKDIQLKNYFTTGKLSWNPRFHNPDLKKWLHRIKVPTMIIWGENDNIFPLEYGEAFKESIPNSELHIITKCGHLPHQEKTQEFLEAMGTLTSKN